MEMFNSLKEISSYTQAHQVLWNAQIELLTLCNFACQHCYIPNRTSKGLPLLVIKDLATAFFNMGTFNITLTGGEPLLRDDIFEIIEEFRNKGLRVKLYSNASLLDRDKCIRLKELGISQFSTTIFSLNPQINDCITCKNDSLNFILTNIALLEELCVTVQIKMPILKMNYESYEELKTFCGAHNYSFFPSPNISPKTDGDSSPLKFELAEREFAKMIRKIDAEHTKNVTGDQNAFRKEDIICHSLNNSVFINSIGDVFPCISWPVKLGNIFEKSIAEIWNTSDVLQYLRSLKKSHMKFCGKCEYSTHCTVCPGDSMMDGDMLGCSHLQKKCAKAIMGLI